MLINTAHIVGLRAAIEESSNDFLVGLYKEMAEDIKPKISEAMLDSFRGSILAGRTYEQASSELGISKIAVGQNALKAAKRIVSYEEMMGREVPSELSGSQFTATVARNHVEFFNSALSRYIQLN
ncbi:MAG: hypothetical protein ABJG42_24325 [Vibrio splendidus]